MYIQPMCCTLPQCWRGKVTKTVPFDRIQDVVVTEKGGKYCCCYETTIDAIGVQTASGNGGFEIALKGVEVRRVHSGCSFSMLLLCDGPIGTAGEGRCRGNGRGRVCVWLRKRGARGKNMFRCVKSTL